MHATVSVEYHTIINRQQLGIQIIHSQQLSNTHGNQKHAGDVKSSAPQNNISHKNQIARGLASSLKHDRKVTAAPYLWSRDGNNMKTETTFNTYNKLAPYDNFHNSTEDRRQGAELKHAIVSNITLTVMAITDTSLHWVLLSLSGNARTDE